jgi:hypothetical protein
MKVLDRTLVDKEDVRHMDEVQLARLGIRMVDRQALTLQCVSCGHTWEPQLDCDGKLAFDYWLCPSQCNL